MTIVKLEIRIDADHGRMNAVHKKALALARDILRVHPHGTNICTSDGSFLFRAKFEEVSGVRREKEDAIMRIVHLHPGLRSFSVFRMAGLADMDPDCRSAMVYRLRQKGVLAPNSGGKDAGRLYPVAYVAPVFASSGPTASVPVRGGALDRPVVAQAAVGPLDKKGQAIAQRASVRGTP